MHKLQSIYEAEVEAMNIARNRINQVQGNYHAKYRVRGKWLTVTDLHGSFLYTFNGEKVDRERAAYLIATR